MYSIYAKFSALNGISAIEASEYISKNIGVVLDSPFLTSEHQVKKLSKLLDEPHAVALTLKRPNRYSQQWPLEMLDRSSGLVSPDDIVFCLECVKLDFHGLFQISECIPICPIHNIRLTRFNSKTGRSGVDRIVRNLIRVYRKYNHQWPSTMHRSKPVRSPAQSEKIEEYLYWSYHAQLRRHEFRNATLWSHQGEGLGNQDWCTFDVATALLVMRKTFVHGSQAANSLLRNFKTISDHEQVLECHLDSESAQLLSQAFSPGVIYLYKLWWAWTGRARVREQMLVDIVSEVSKDHIDCDCKWLLNGSDKQWVKSSRVPINRSEYFCPHRYVANFLNERWGTLDASVRRSQRDQMRWAYIRYAEDISKKGVVSCDHLTAGIVANADSHQPLDLQWKLPEQILEIIEQCMSTALELDLSMCLEWLTSVDRGEDPKICKTAPQSAVAIFANSTVGVMKWRVNANNAES
jgi:hypothetical protein